jgi:hypothetical protein
VSADADADGSTDAGDPDAAGESAFAGPEPSGFGRRGWLLVGAVVATTLVVPGLVYALPALPADAGLPFLVAALVLPLAPALALGLVAVWSMTAAAGDAGRLDD